MFRRTVRTALTGTTLGLVAALSIVSSASAHVTVNPREATQGGFTRVAFRVPTESDSLNTTKVEVQMPTDHPIASVSLMPVPGWTAEVQKKKLDTPVKTDDGELTEAVSVITWTAAEDAVIKPGQFQEFPVSLGPLPEAASLTFKALQTYSDGSVVRWIDEGSNAEHPAPVLKLTAATAASASATPVASATKANDEADETNGLAIAGLVAGILGLLLGGAAFIRTGRRSSLGG